VFCQGIGFLSVKPAMAEGMPPLAVSAVRLLGAAFLMSVVGLWPARIFRSKTPLTPPLLGQTILPGIIGYIVSTSLLLYAFANFHAGLAAILGSLSPVLVLPILWLKEGQAPSCMATIGALTVIGGTAIIVLL
jgi:drug/metabolite transporter (DMT)-like permease